MKIYDIVIIGSGPGGYVSAIKASQLGFKTALIEKYNHLGGTCLNVGCIPSKILLDSSEKFYEANKTFHNHGIIIDKLSLNFEKLIHRKNKIIKKLSEGIQFLVKKNKIDIFCGNASFIDNNNILISSNNEIYHTLTFKNAIIATGSKPNTILIDKVGSDKIISSNEALSLDKIPKKLIILGGGVIGLELGLVYSRLGSTVLVIENESRIVPFMDFDISKELEKILCLKNIKFYLSTEVVNIETKNNNVNIKVKNKDGSYDNIIGDYCLVSIGRTPFTKGLNLEKVGIKVNDKGFIQVDKSLKTNIENIYAIGDVIGGLMVAHKASDEGIFVVENISGQKPSINYKAIPLVIYTSPEVASVGYTEHELLKNKINYKIGKFPIKLLGKSVSTDNNEGFTKILTDDKTDEILGVHIISPRASDMIMEAVVAMEFRATSEDIYRICHPHPTFIESLKEASMLSFYGKSIHM